MPLAGATVVVSQQHASGFALKEHWERAVISNGAGPHAWTTGCTYA
jgi:hypothetical protein